MKTTKTKNLLLGIAIGIGTSFATVAQNVPNYVPTNGLVGWWPFNGNANDESGNNNNGTVNGATLTSDRFGNPNSAYYFSSAGCGTRIDAMVNTSSIQTGLTISIWVMKSGNGCAGPRLLEFWPGSDGPGQAQWGWDNNNNASFGSRTSNNTVVQSLFTPVSINNWTNLTYVNDGANGKFYQDGVLINTLVSSGNPILASNASFGRMNHPAFDAFNGKLDDIAIWNRALTQQEVTNLYSSVNCNNNLAITPQINILQIGNTATFNATTSDTNPNYVWQSDFGQGFQTLNNFGNYSGVNSNTLSITNVQLANHNQPIRAISTSGNCVDTSNIAYINIVDTCITTTNETIYDTTFVTVTDTNYVTVYDTVTTYISVTDTLFINVNTVGLNNNTIINTIKVFPNPANSLLNLDFGNFNSLNGYSIKIYNSLSQVIYNQQITQQSETIDLSTFGGNGVYFLHVINAQNNTVEIRKIVLQ
jgi:hypothetical protein